MSSEGRNRTRRPAADTREHVLAVAQELFYRYGIRATGVDTLAAEAGVAPTTLYRLFGSKDGLVTAYLERASRRYRQWFDEAAASAGNDPRAAVLAVFDALSGQVLPDSCRGCPFLIALSELAEPDSPGRPPAIALKKWVRARFAELAGAIGAADPEGLADRLALVMEGVYASVQALGVDGPARQARDLAAALLDTAVAA